MFIIAALYHFTRFDDIVAVQGPLFDLCKAYGINGTLLLAPEGINGTIAGDRAGIDATISHIQSLLGCAALEWKESTSTTPPFHRMKVRLKREIVTMGQPDVDPATSVGNYVEPVDWNALIRSPDVAVIDTRNDYEVAIGTFDGAITPQTKSFGEFPAWWEDNKARFQNKKIAMFCTGGIRCEKSTNFLISQGVDDVYHLKGGILKYLEDIPQNDSTWDGDCFVFDARVSVGHGLKKGPHILCYACRRPLLSTDCERLDFEVGVACHQCVTDTSDIDKTRFRERQKQIGIARKRGLHHISGQT